MKDRNDYPVLALGATMPALGWATARPRDVLVVERTATPAPEFVNALGGDGAPPAAPCSPPGQSLRDDLAARGILQGNRLHRPALAAVYAQTVKSRNLAVLFWTDVIEITPCRDGYSVQIINASGIRDLTVGRIIDTTPDPVCRPATTTGWPRWTEKQLRALVHGPTAALPENTGGDVAWHPGGFDTESVFGVRLNPETDWPAARAVLLDAWRRRPTAWADARLAAMATEFWYRCPAGPFAIGGGWAHLPAAAYTDPIAGFEAGYALAMEETK